jgi:hypothetical protein
MARRLRITQTTDLADHFAKESRKLGDAATQLSPRPTRDEYQKKSKESQVDARLIGWVNSPGLRRPE